MKKVKGLAVLFIICSSHIFAGTSGSEAAKEITVETISKDISRGKQTGMKIDIFQASKKDVAKHWSKLINQKTKSKVEERDNEIFIIGTNISEISNAPLNIYAVINDYMDHVEVNAFFETPDGFVSEEKAQTEFLSCRKFLRDFGVDAYKDAVNLELKGEQKKLYDLNSDLKLIVNSNDKLHKNIGKQERDITDAQNDIESNELEQERLRSEIYYAKGHIYDIKGSEAKKEAEKALKDLENDLSTLKRQNESRNKEIDKSQADIRSYEREIENNKLLMSRKDDEIDRQAEVIYQVEQKLVAIR